jgi:hypothetical protein
VGGMSDKRNWRRGAAWVCSIALAVVGLQIVNLGLDSKRLAFILAGTALFVLGIRLMPLPRKKLS